MRVGVNEGRGNREDDAGGAEGDKPDGSAIVMGSGEEGEEAAGGLSTVD